MLQTIERWIIGDGGLYNNEPAVILATKDDKLYIAAFSKDGGKKLWIDCNEFTVKVRMIQEGNEHNKDN